MRKHGLLLVIAGALCWGCSSPKVETPPATETTAQSDQVPPDERGSAPWIVETFFGSAEFPDAAQYYTGEMLENLDKPPVGAFMPPGFSLSITLLEETPQRLVYRAAYSRTPKPADWYAYLEQSEGRWKLAAVRSFILPKPLREFYAQLKAMPNRTEEEEAEFLKMQQLLSSDVELRNFLRRKAGRFDGLVKFIAESAPREEYVHLLRELRVEDGRLDSDGRLILEIGGADGQSVGFMFVPGGHVPPRMDPGGFILVERVVGRWYLFKTT
ncbi:MAG TPA: hypothetical protein VEC99_06315 [Clostridia bacterium]|nr:hypothetical protein [Clostridia bacterium]